MTDRPLKDTWVDRDFPVLIGIARRLDENPGDSLFVSEVADAAGVDPDTALRATAALVEGGYIRAKSLSTYGNTEYDVNGLTEKGRRASGLWPEGDTFDALIDALQEAADNTDDPDERGKLEKLRHTALDTGKGVMNAVIQAWIKRMTGLG